MTAKYTLIQYVPDPIAEERVNVGVVTWDKKHIYSRFLADWRRVRSFGGEDIGFLRDFAKNFPEMTSPQMPLQGTGGIPDLDVSHLEKMVRDWGHSIQFAEPRGSLKSAQALLYDIAPLFLRERERGRPQPRTKATAAKVAATILLDVVRQTVPEEEAAELVKKNETIAGDVEPHRFDVVLANGSLLAALHAISFEINEGEHLEKELVNTKWTLADVRNKYGELPLAVFTLPPTAKGTEPVYRDAIRAFKRLDATVVTTEKMMGKWSRECARPLAA